MKARDGFPIIQTALGNWRAQVLFTTNELDVFNLLSRKAMTSVEVARRCESSADYTERLLNACVPLGLLTKSEGRFRNTALAENFLVRGTPHYLGHWVQVMSHWYRPWGRLHEAILNGKAVEDPLEHLGKDADYTRRFTLAMHDYAMGPGRGMANAVDLTGRSTMLDVGAGPGSYSILLAERYPQLKPVLFDLPPVLAIARELVSQSSVSARIAFREGDYLVDDLGQGFDVVLLSNMLHQESPQACGLILRKAYDALAKDGLLLVQSMFLNAEKDGPAWPTLQSLQLLLVYEGGRQYSLDETLDMIAKAGFVKPDVKTMALLNAESLVVARKG